MRGILLKKRYWLILAAVATMVAAACGGGDTSDSAPTEESAAAPTPTPQLESSPTPDPSSGATSSTSPLLDSLLRQETQGRDDSVLSNFRQLLPRDAIRPIYEPGFVTISEAKMKEEELVIGVSINGDSIAYPISILRRREMVNDTVGGRPILVTW